MYAIDSVFLLHEKRKYLGYNFILTIYLWEWGRVSGLYHHKSNPPYFQTMYAFNYNETQKKKTPNTILISFLILWFIWFYFYYPFYARLNVCIYIKKTELMFMEYIHPYRLKWFLNVYCIIAYYMERFFFSSSFFLMLPEHKHI